MYNGRTFNREQLYFCGNYFDGAIYPVFQPPGRRRKRCHPTKEIQKKLNQRNAEKRLVRTVHMNFTADDLALTITFAQGNEPENENDALRIVQNFLRRLNRRYKKLGLVLKYIMAIEYGEKNGRCHAHLIISGGMDRDETEKLWGLGYANTKRLQFDADKGITGLAKYTLKDKHFYKRWSGSRNLIRPEPAEIDGQISVDDMREIAEMAEDGTAWQWFEEKYPEFRLVEASVERNEINHMLYIRFEMVRRE